MIQKTKILFLITCLFVLIHNQCGEGCSACNPVTSSCYTCQANYSMTCVPQSLEASCSCFICSQVVPNCLQCGNYVCNQCQPSFYLNGQSKCSGCGSYCLSCVTSNACNECMTNYTTDPNEIYSNCYPFCGVANCLGCSAFNICSKCAQGYIIDSYGECIQKQSNRLLWIAFAIIFVAGVIAAIVIVLSCKKHKRCCFKSEELLNYKKFANQKITSEIQM